MTTPNRSKRQNRMLKDAKTARNVICKLAVKYFVTYEQSIKIYITYANKT